MDTPIRLEDLIDLVESQNPTGGPLDFLADSMVMADQMGQLSDALIGHFVDLARAAGASWSEVGQSLGVTKQAAQKRFVGPRRQKQTGLFTRFAPEARRVVIDAQDQARRLGSPHVGTEHILLALVEDADGLGARAIAACGVSPDDVTTLAGQKAEPESAPSRGHIPFTAESKKLLELSLREALRLGHDRIGTEDILLGMLRDGGSAAGVILSSLGVKRATVEKYVTAHAAD